ncbi:RNA-binding cell elongation regulator Jag/EloR [Paenibacillus gansuensis]|uniref:RNA-binding protein KhpB n=1 Tax=Paenibacillus gansuensis TaxID=306542 RepID=A0ABW5PJ19_9BACL
MKMVSTGKTIDDAVRAGLSELNVSEDRVEILVLEQPTKGFLGFGSKPAKVELTLLPEPVDPVEEAMNYLLQITRSMNLEVSLERHNSRDGILINLVGRELGILIGRRGQTLDSLQYLVNIVGNRYSTSHLRIHLDAENFRERRKQTLEELSERLAGRVLKTRKEVVLEPMSSQERKVIHARLQNHPKVKTYSKGDEPNRRVVIAMK